MAARKARSAVAAAAVSWSLRKASACLSDISSARVSMARAPWPTAGIMVVTGRSWQMRSARPRRCRPASARMMASYWPSSSFFRRVSTLPRRSLTIRSGRVWSSWALRRRLDVPMQAPAGRDSRVAYVLETKASWTWWRAVMAARQRPSGTSAGRSFRLWTARSMVPSRRRRSNSVVNSPLPPMRAKGTSRILSPCVTMCWSWTDSSGSWRRRASAT